MSVRAPVPPQQRTSAPSNSAPVRPLEYPVEDTTSCSGKDVTAEEENRGFQQSLSAASLKRLARELGVSAESLLRLGIGFDTHAYTFPMTAADGRIVGFRLRPLKGGKLTRAGGKLGLFVPEGVSPANVEVICEGESDTAAALTRDLSAIGTPGAHQAHEAVVAFLTECTVVTPCIVADSDAAGLASADRLAETMCNNGTPCRILGPPEPYGDLREWIAAGSLTGQQLRDEIDQLPIRFPDDWPPGFVQLPNAFIRNGAVRRIGPTAFALACALASFRGADKRVFPSRDVLGDVLGVSVSTVDRAKAKLQEAGVLTWRRGRRNRCNEYVVNFGPLRKRK